ncbi:MAG: hypothetical protein IPN69_08675 [Acidobacteria bacterium]|nr:hypothetical protein [Acidobacteriota bacterium]
MVIKDWFPMPALKIASLNTALPPCGGGNFPAANSMCYESVDTVTAGLLTVTAGQLPAVSTLQSDNSVSFNYGTRNDPANQQAVISILISLTFTTDPYADGLSFLNEARECESNTFGTTFCQIAVAPFVLTEPNLKVTKA